VVAPSAIALLVGLTMALATFPGLNHSLEIPDSPPSIIQQVALIVLTISLAIGNDVSIRFHLINRDRYFAEKPIAYFKIGFRCFWVTLPCYLIIYLNQLKAGGLGYLGQYLKQLTIWPAVPAICGILVAVSLDRPADNHYDRAISGVIQGAALAVAAWLVVVLGAGGDVSPPYQGYILIVYGGFGFVIGANLPAAIRRYRVAQQKQMPQRVAALYNEVSRYFYDYGQFNEWLYARNPALGRKLPSDIRLEETGMGRLINFVSETRKQFGAQTG
jgi:hypothetical protein